MRRFRRRRAARGVLGVAVAFAWLPGQAASAQSAIVRYECDLAGMRAELVARVEAIRETGIVRGAGPNVPITGVIGTGNQTLVYEGELRSPVRSYTFVGENQFADFTDGASYERFRVQFLTQPDGSLILVANPFGPQPARYLCMPAR